ncbi:MAG: N-acetyl-alpha-D-glucosaminyl L-malate synthase BshA [Bacteroidia bacterium]|nr:N-acetyl-alpha-D-glucosaminyl L-malate synthase BshA [Bacteroidia bacterium]NNC85629.1 N-acetyl-alpha-D-glucosaminyl L-malate synthase BshA [Bacteroidia bacterium]
MRIGVVCYPTFGGSGVVAVELGKALSDKGHDIHVITYSQPVRLDFFSANLAYHEVTIPKYPLFQYVPYETALTSKVVDVAIHEKLDLLHVHYAIPHASAAFMAQQILRSKGVNMPFVTTLHGTDITLVGKDPSYEPVVTFAINNSDGVTTVSESLKRDTYSNFDIKNEIEVIPNFIDLKRFSRKPKEHFKKAIAPNNERIVVHTSNFRKVKRVQDVVKVFDKVSKEINAKLLLIGDGPERVKIEELCRELGSCDDIRFLGKQEAIEEILSVCDLFIMPSETESFGLAALEAMACQVPVISSNSGGIPELNQEGFSGYLSKVGDVNDMAQKAISILKDDSTLNMFKENALVQARKFDVNQIMPLYEQYYQKVLAGNSVKVSS